MSSEHVEVLWAMLRKCVNERLARKSADREAAALAAAIEALKSAPQPPAEAQAQGRGEVAYFRKEMLRRCRDYAAGMTEIGADPADLEAALAPLLAPPSVPVGVEGLPEKWRREAPRARVDVGEDALLAWREAVYWCAFQLEAALAQQPAADTYNRRLKAQLEQEWANLQDLKRAYQTQQPAAVDGDVRELLDAMDSGADPRPAFLRLRQRFPARAAQPGGSQ